MVVWAMLGLAAAPLWGQFGSFAPPAREQNIRVEAVPSHLAVRPGQTFHVAVDIRIEDGWKYYAPYPGPVKDLLGARVVARVGDRPIDPAKVLWPPDRPYNDVGGKTTNVYVGRTVAYVPVSVPAEAGKGPLNIRVALDGQACSKETCARLPSPTGLDAIAGRATVQVAAEARPNPAWQADERIAGGLAAAKTAAEIEAAHKAEQQRSKAAGELAAGGGKGVERLTVWGGLGLALLAGLILNVMPCVLPVIPIRILSIVNMAKENKRRIVTLGLTFAGGIVVFFVALGAVNVGLRLLGRGTFDLGEHFSVPWVRIVLGMIVVALAANLLGAFNVVVPSKVAGLGQGGEGSESHAKSLGMGVMMAVLATPCSFAFLAAALAWAQIQPLWLGTLAIVLIGVGMAAPHALLVAWPGLLQKMPKPGRWMELFKQTMGFLLLPVALWLFATLGGDSYPFWVAGYGVVLAFCLWVWGTWVRYDARLWKKLIIRGLTVALAVGAGFWMLTPPKPLAVEFEDYHPVRLQVLRNEQRPVLVKFTASWCLKCREIDANVYDHEDVASELQQRGVAALKADVTDRSSQANRFLRGTFDRQPPLTVLYSGKGDPPKLLVGGYSQQDLLDALDAVGATRERR